MGRVVWVRRSECRGCFPTFWFDKMCELWPNLLRWGGCDFLLCYGKLLAVIKGSGCGYVGFGMCSRQPSAVLVDTWVVSMQVGI